MWNNTYIIVDDIFQGFSDNNETVLTRTELYSKLLSNKVNLDNINLIIGQGINELDLRAMIRSLNVDIRRFSFTNDSNYVKASKNNTHKNYFQNIIVSVARRTMDKVYELDLMLDGANEFFADHMTGQHIQGMALIEAARQAFLSVTEQFYLASNKEKIYFVINDINIKYKRFLFPVSSKVRYTILEENITEDKMAFDVSIDILQDGKVCATTAVTFTAFKYEVIHKKELRAAQKVVASIIKQQASVHLSQELV
ncbi:hypothetical protein BGP78_13805 [Pseudoalteromonas sp. MSK9-3]|uniref:AfsA-related hotdog domain-containing protein n=1 Tax=Pseudoalteromonas sp. MSK9-3 TaxID=1897633 RepID=UPI000E6CAD3C|nr:AfsA-related hotdog domain-containing protein [Pseudoalteromonas sp. MSK9-3]RJE76083.1 hypothetical protein BGP78_13805 [Pseudoalteromonas sp. MSK9-3]